MAALLMVTTLGLSNAQPARADGATSTRNIILGVAALATGLIISNNVAQKNQLANTVAGYTPQGDTVFQDGRVVDRYGNSYYPGNQGESISCQDNSCQIIAADNANQGYYNGYNPNPGYTAVNVNLAFGSNGYDRNGYDRNGFDRNGYNRSGFDRNGRSRNQNNSRNQYNGRNQNNGRGH
jgi:hypothetical protein